MTGRDPFDDGFENPDYDRMREQILDHMPADGENPDFLDDPALTNCKECGSDDGVNRDTKLCSNCRPKEGSTDNAEEYPECPNQECPNDNGVVLSDKSGGVATYYCYSCSGTFN